MQRARAPLTGPSNAPHAVAGSIAPCGVVLWAMMVAACGRPSTPVGPALLDLDAPTLAAELAAGRVSAEAATRASLARMAEIDAAGPALNSIIEVNPDAIEIARELDRRWAAGGPVGPLHGLPVAIKANIDTDDRMATSAGSLALAGHHAAADAELVAQLRAAGAVIIAKTNLSEWANFRSMDSTSGWSSLGGQTKNPYVLDRNPCGSSSGSAVAVAARLVPLAVGTETVGSIVCPAAANGVVGIKPTQGLVSQRGIVPLAASFDTAGPMARTVAGAALLLAAMQLVPAADYKAELENLAGVRLGVLHTYRFADVDPGVEAAFAATLQLLEAQGATLVEPADMESLPGFSTAVLEALLFEFKAGLNYYLAEAGIEPRSLEALIAFNSANADTVMPIFGQDLLERSVAHGGLDDADYAEALKASKIALQAQLQALFSEHALDALVVPVNEPAEQIDWVNGDSRSLSSAYLAAVSGYASVAMPSAMIGELPVSIAFVGEPSSDAQLIEIAAAFERARGPLPAPRFIPTLRE